MFSTSSSLVVTFVMSVLCIHCVTSQTNELGDYLNITDTSYTGEPGVGVLSVSFAYESVYMIGSVEWTTSVSVVDQPDCNPLTHNGDDYVYEFTYDGAGSCRGNFTELEDGIRTRYFVTFYFESFREVFPGVLAYQIQTEKLVDHIVLNKPTGVPDTLEVVTEVDVTDVMSGDVVPLVIGFDENELSVWTAILITKCEVSNNEQFLNDTDQNKYSEVAFDNGCPQALSSGDMVLSQQSRQTYTQVKVEWTVEGFVYGDPQMWLKCLTTLCDIRGECAIPSCNGRQVDIAATLEHETIFTVENLRYPTITQATTTTSEQPHEITTTTSEQPHEITTTTSEQPHEITTTTSEQPHEITTTTSEQPHEITTEQIVTTLPPLTLNMLFYESGSTLPTFDTVEGNNIQIRITKSNTNSPYNDMMLESCQISNNEKFNYIPSQQLFADTFMLENCPQMSLMEVLTPVFSDNGNTININVKAFKYSTGSNVFFRCTIVACTVSTPESCQPQNECIVNDPRHSSRLLSALSRSTYSTVTGRINVVENPSASSAECPEGEICTETTQFASMVGLLGGVLLLAVVVIVIELYRVAKFKQKLKYERRPYIDGYDNSAGPVGSVAVSGSSGSREARAAGGYNGRVVY